MDPVASQSNVSCVENVILISPVVLEMVTMMMMMTTTTVTTVCAVI